MNGIGRTCLLTLGLTVAWGWSCAGEAPSASVDLLARKPDDDEAARGIKVILGQRRVQMDPGAVVRYRIEPLAPGNVRLAARAGGPGTLEAAWFALDLDSGGETPRESWRVGLEGPGDVERIFPLPVEKSLMELRLAWRAPAGGAKLELRELGLHEVTPVERPSIVLIVIDTLSARHLSTYGYLLETDPELARLASESFVFERCFSNATWTVPSFMSLMTGLYSRAHELSPRGVKIWEQWYLAQSRWTLAESLRAAGYRTGGFVDTTWITEMLGVPQGFDVYDSSAAKGPYAKQGIREGGIRRTAALARGFLEGLRPQEPFLLFLHALDVHGAYLAEPSTWPYTPELEPYDRERTKPAGGSSQAFGIIPTYIARGEVPSGELPSRMHTAHLERAYDAGIRFVDEELGKFFDFLRDAGLLEHSWLVLTADHGEMMADSTFLFGHGVLDQDVTHVPLLIRPPGGYPGGKRIAEAVQLVDLYPTLIELLGLERRARLHGRSLVNLLRNEEPAPGIVLVETGVTRQAMLVAGGWMLIELEPTKDLNEDVGLISHRLLMQNLPSLADLEARGKRKGPLLSWLDNVELKRDFFERLPESGPTEELMAQMRARKGYGSLLDFIKQVLKGQFYELYDLETDPAAEHDVSAQHPEKVAELKKLLKREQRRRTEAWRLARPPAKPVELPAEDIQALEALGYGGGSGDE